MSRTTLAGLARRVPWGLVGMIALVAAVEGLIHAGSMGLYDVDEWAFRWTARAASRGANGAEVVVFGDSLAKLGVVPSVLAERTGKRAFNLALSGSQSTTSYFLLKRVLDSGAKPEAIVVDFNPPLLRVGPRHILNRWGAMLGPVEAAELAWWSGDSDLFGEVATQHLLPSMRGKSTIRANILDALANRPVTNLAKNKMAVRNWKQNEGAQLMVGSYGVDHLTDADVENLRTGYYPEWRCHPANVRGIDRFLDLATRNKIRVFWLLPPMLPALHDKLASSGIDARHEAFIRSWQAKYPDLVVLDARKTVDPLVAFWDPQHLSICGASSFSKVLGDALRGSIEGPTVARWVAMPGVPLGPLPPGVEDIDQSRLAVDAIDRVVR